MFQQPPDNIVQTTDLTQSTSLILSNIDISTQGTPSPNSCLRGSSINLEPEYTDQVRYDENFVRKRSFLASRTGPEIEAEEYKRFKTSRASPWLVENI